MEKIQPKNMIANTGVPKFQAPLTMKLKLLSDTGWKEKDSMFRQMTRGRKINTKHRDKTCLACCGCQIGCSPSAGWPIISGPLPLVISHNSLESKGG